MPIVAAWVAREAFPRDEHAALRAAATARIAGMTRGQYLASLAALLRFDVGERLAEIRCPTLIVAGARDATVPLAAKEAIATTIPHARLALLEDSGHVSPHDDPGGFNRLLLDHLHRASA